MKTATITWIKWDNYGSLLQAYALQQYLLSAGYDNVILDDTGIKELDKKFRYTWKIIIIRFVLWVKNKIKGKSQYNENVICVSKRFNEFRNKYLITDKKLKDIEALNMRYDVFICGSDQIWNPGSVKLPSINNAPFYYAGFSNKKKISYAVSFGLKVYPEKFKKQLRSLLSSFSYISVREPTGGCIIKDVISKDAQLVVDPTLLLDEEQWKKLIKNREMNQKYIFAYFLSNSQWYINFALDFAKKIKMPLHIIYNHEEFGALDVTHIGAGPKEFLDELYNASLVLTDSFHATVFSVIFEKEFYVFKRFECPRNEGQNTRVDNLVKTIEIPDRFVERDNVGSIGKQSRIDFVKCKSRLQPIIQSSKDYIKIALG